MAHAVLSQPYFHNEAAAFAYVEATLWPYGPVCPHCKATAEKIGALKARTKPSKRNPEGVERHGLRKCYACRKEFTVRVGTIFEDSHLPLHLWLQAIHLLASGKKGISTRHIQRLLNCSMKTAWFLTHRIREIMKPDASAEGLPPLGGAGMTLEADETYIGAKAGRKLYRAPVEKRPVFALVERQGRVRSFHVPNVRAATLSRVLANNSLRQSTLMTDEAQVYMGIGWNYARHDYVKHSEDEYVRGDVYTNTVEGFFSILKRGLYGTYQHVSEHHLYRYLNEFDFRYNNREKLGIDDASRAGYAVQNAKGRRLTYGRVGGNA
jgi:transposase-like protein